MVNWAADIKILAAITGVMICVFLLGEALGENHMAHRPLVPNHPPSTSKTTGTGFQISISLTASDGTAPVPPGHYLCTYLIVPAPKAQPVLPAVIDSKTLTCPGIPGARATLIYRDGRPWRRYDYTRTIFADGSNTKN